MAPLHRFIAAFVRYQAHVFAFLYLVANPFPGFTARGGYPLAIVVDDPSASGGSSPSSACCSRCLRSSSRARSRRSCSWRLGGWFASLVTGRMPSGLRALGAVTIRYSAQVTAYLLA